MTSSTKPEVHNVSQRRQDRVTAIGNVTCTKSLVTFGRVVFELCEQTDRQTDPQSRRRTHHNILHPSRGNKC